jgi:hypothetical protein
MSKKKKRKEERERGGGQTPGADVLGASGPVEADPISSTGKKTIAAGVVLAAAGFLVLTRADSMGRNWAASLSPFLILGGYALMGWGIFRDDPSPEAAPSAPASEGGEPPALASPSLPPEKTT